MVQYRAIGLLTMRQTDKRTRARGRKHIPPTLSEVNNSKMVHDRAIVTMADQQKVVGPI